VPIKRGRRCDLYPSANRARISSPPRPVRRVPGAVTTTWAFGIGAHFCLGANLRPARAGDHSTICSDSPRYGAGGPYRRRASNLIDGVKDIPVRFTPGG